MNNENSTRFFVYILAFCGTNHINDLKFKEKSMRLQAPLLSRSRSLLIIVFTQHDLTKQQTYKRSFITQANERIKRNEKKIQIH